MFERPLRRVVVATVAGALLSSVTPSLAAEVISDGRFMIIKGEIRPGDYQSIFYASIDTDWVYIDSPGGDVQEAMKIGRFFRAFKYRVVVPKGMSCVSACVLVLVGAPDRMIDEEARGIGLHRPHFPAEQFSQLNSDKAEAAQKEAMRAVGLYLEDMEVPDKMTEAIMATRSASVKMLSGPELVSDYGFEFRSPGYEEWLIAKCGTLSDQEWSNLVGDASSHYISDGEREILRQRATVITECGEEARNAENERKDNLANEYLRACIKETDQSDEEQIRCVNETAEFAYKHL